MSGGELWRTNWQAGKEGTPGTPVPATRKMHFDMESSNLGDTRASNVYRTGIGARYNVTAVTAGPIQPGGTVRQLLSPFESLELFEMGIQGGVVPATPSGGTTAREWVYKPGNTLQSVTLEYNDGAQDWQEAGTVASDLSITGTVDGQNQVEATLFGAKLDNLPPTPLLPNRTPDFLEGWQVGVAIDDPGDVPFTTPIPGVIRGWTIRFVNNLVRRYAGNFTQQARDVAYGAFDATAEIALLADDPAVMAEYVKRRDRVPRLLSIMFRDEAVIEGTIYPMVRVDLPGYWTVMDRGQVGGGVWREYRLTLQTMYDSGLANMAALTAVNTRTATFDAA